MQVASSPTRNPKRSEAALYVQAKLAELRSDPILLHEFSTRVEEFSLEHRARTEVCRQTFITSNREAVIAVSSEEFAELARRRAVEKMKLGGARRARAAEVRHATEAERAAQAALAVATTEARMRRVAMARHIHRQEAWLVAIAMAARSCKLAKALESARDRQAELARFLTLAKSLCLMWRLYVMRRRLRGLCKVSK